MKMGKKKVNNKFAASKWILVLVAVWSAISMLALVASAAATSTFSCFQLSATSDGEVSIATTATGWSITAKGINDACGKGSTTSVTFTITNTGTKSDGSVRAVNFKITTTGMGTDDTNVSKTLDSTTTSLTYTATSGSGSGNAATITISFSDIAQEALGASVITTVKPGVGGTVAVDGTAVTSQTDFTNQDDHVYTLTATPNSGYEFYGWMSSEGPLSTDGSTSFSYAGLNTSTLWPVFVKSGSAIFYIKDASPVTYYGFLDEAITAAGASGTIVTQQGGTVYGATTSTFNLSGQTLLLPYAVGQTAVNDASASHPYANTVANGATAAITHSGKAWLNLTIPSGATLNVGSGAKLVVGGQYSGAQPIGGATYGSYAELKLAENAVVNVDGGILSSYGYITGNGKVNLNSGSLYEPYIVTDFHGGTYSAVAYKKLGRAPFNSYSMLNVQSELKITAGASVYGYCSLYASDKQNPTTAQVVGSSGILNLTSGTITATYDSSDLYKVGSYSFGKKRLTIDGEATVQSLQMNAAGQDIDTAEVLFPVPSTFAINQVSGTLSVPNQVAIFPGTEITISKNAALNASKALVVMDGMSAKVYSASSAYGTKAGTDPERGRLVVDGTMTIASSATFAGIVETTGTGKVVVGSNTTLSSTFTDGVVKGDSYILYSASTTNQTSYPLTAKLLKPGHEATSANVTTDTSNFIAMEAGVTYSALSDGTISTNAYQYNTYADDKTATLTDKSYSSAETIQGVWARYKVTLDPNGGAGSAYTTGTLTTSFQLPVNSFTYDGHIFTGWNTAADGSGTNYNDQATLTGLTSDVTLYAQWQATISVVWKNDDGSVLETDSNVISGSTPIYNGATPTKASSAGASYTFAGWEDDAGNRYTNLSTYKVTQSVVFTAYYTETTRSYTITWKDYDGTVLSSATVDYGIVPNAPTSPTRATDGKNLYTFSGWAPAITAVTGEVTYTAQYSSVPVVATVMVAEKTDPVGYYASLSEAIGACTAPDYVQMVTNGSASDITLTKDLYLDLNGCQVTLEKLNAGETVKLYVMDFETNAYGESAGRLEIDDDSIIPDIVSYDLDGKEGALVPRYYVKVSFKGNVYAFPRVAVTVSGIQFFLDSTGSHVLAMEGTFRGNSVAAEALHDIGFKLGTAETWINQSKLADAEATNTEAALLKFSDLATVAYGMTVTKLSDISTVQALLGFGTYNNTYMDYVPSLDRAPDIVTALKALPTTGLTESQIALLQAFLNG